jgi:putative ABC transport system permease protein
MRETTSFVWVADAAQDVRYGLRVLLGRPGFTAAVVATLALGIGASTAIFSVAYGVSLRPLPYPDPDRLVRIYEANPANAQLKHDVSLAAFHEWRTGAASIESAAVFGKPGTRFLAGADGTPVTVMSVSPAFFEVVGVKPARGPGFKPEREYTRFTADTEVVLSHGAWQRLLGGRPDVIGRQMVFGGVGEPDVYEIVGVMPEGFEFGEAVDLWKPTQIVELPIRRLFRQWRYDRVVARLKPHASLAEARAEIEAVSARLGREFPATNGGWTATVESLQDSIVGSFRRATWLLLAGVGVVLLVACLNVGGLLLARALTRERETAVRVALGAGLSRLIRLWLAEAVLLTGAGAGLGLLLAWTGVTTLRVAAPPGIPRIEAVALDLPVLVVAAISTVLAAVVAAMAPLVAARRWDFTGGLRSGRTGEAPRRQAVRTALTAAQCAGAVTLAILAVLLTRSFMKLTALDPGWDAARVLSLHASPPMPPELRRPWARYVEWSDRLVAQLESTPGIERAAITTQIPLSPQPYPATLARGRGTSGADPSRWPCVSHNVSDGYFEAMGIRVVAGRTFGRGDRFTALQLIDSSQRPERGTAMVSETAARTLWPGQSAIGQAIWLPDIDVVAWREVIGIVEDIQFHAVGESPVAHVFVPWTQFPSGNPKLVVKGTGAAATLVPVVRQVLQAVEPGTHVDRVVPLEELASRATAQPRFTSRVVALFGALALVLAAVGLHGMLAYVVRARTREIGIRLALGAAPRAIVARILARALAPAAAGVVIGVAVAATLARTFRALFFEVAPLDAASYASGALLLLGVSLGAALGPAVAAARVDPATTLRAE